MQVVTDVQNTDSKNQWKLDQMKGCCKMYQCIPKRRFFSISQFQTCQNGARVLRWISQLVVSTPKVDLLKSEELFPQQPAGWVGMGSSKWSFLFQEKTHFPPIPEGWCWEEGQSWHSFDDFTPWGPLPNPFDILRYTQLFGLNLNSSSTSTSGDQQWIALNNSTQHNPNKNHTKLSPPHVHSW